MILRRREVRTLDSLDGLVEHLGTLQREERKAVITISYGWRLFENDERLARPLTAAVLRRRRSGMTGGDSPSTGSAAGTVRATPQCESARMSLSMLRSEQQFREILGRANRSNTSFYPIDPRRVVVFDEDIVPAAGVGVNPLIDPVDDRARLRDRHTALLTMAESTDGLADGRTRAISTPACSGSTTISVPTICSASTPRRSRTGSSMAHRAREAPRRAGARAPRDTWLATTASAPARP